MSSRALSRSGLKLELSKKKKTKVSRACFFHMFVAEAWTQSNEKHNVNVKESALLSIRTQWRIFFPLAVFFIYLL